MTSTNPNHAPNSLPQNAVGGVGLDNQLKQFCDKLIVQSEYDIYWIEVYSKFYDKVFKQPRYKCKTEFAIISLNSEGVYEHTEFEQYTGLNFNPAWNLRLINSQEIQFDFDGETWKDNIDAFYTTCQNLLKDNLNFSCFYAEGMRSPRIIIYDLLPPGLDEAMQNLARLKFARKYVPFEYFHILDKCMLETGQPCALEFAPHFKYGTLFKPIMEVMHADK